jgi:AraC family transcriptional regulator
MPVGVCVDAPDAGGKVNYCAAAALAPGAKAPAGLEVVDVAGGRYAVYRHIGPYAGINAAFNRLLGEWPPSSGLELDGRPALELYRNSPLDTPANALITDLHLPVK